MACVIQGEDVPLFGGYVVLLVGFGPILFSGANTPSNFDTRYTFRLV